MQPKPLLIIQPASSYDDLRELCAERGDEVVWFSEACGVPLDRIKSVKVYAGEPLPDPEDVSAAIITGAIDMVTDDHVWIAETADWVRRATKANCPILGVCFGHQLIANALGGKVGSNPNGASFGNVRVTRINGQTSDEIFDKLPAAMEMKVFHYQSVVELPVGAIVLARSHNEPFYAVRYSDRVWGVQFHPEFDCEIMERTIDVYMDDMIAAGFDVDELRGQNLPDSSGQALLRRFVETADSR